MSFECKPLHESALLTGTDLIGQVLAAQGGCQAHAAPGQGLAQAEDIGHHGGVLTGKQGSGAAEAGGDLVGEIGRASCRERVEIWGGAVAVTKEKREKNAERKGREYTSTNT